MDVVSTSAPGKTEFDGTAGAAPAIRPTLLTNGFNLVKACAMDVAADDRWSKYD
ncbi:MAG: hypothetical protein WD118_10425 [Phycisphaeraceae bacterium]